MEFGILTFHNVLNYGAVLQAQALYSQVNEITDNKCEIIDYQCDALSKMYSVDGGSLKSFLRSIHLNKKKKAFRNYVQKYCRLSHPVNRRTIFNDSQKYKSIIVGSDQVWNCNITNNDATYFLDFADEKTIKASYAASLGSYKPAADMLSYYKGLSEFDGISLREPDGAKIIDNVLEENNISKVHIDPTLLKDASYWAKYAVKPKKTNYIFVYAMETSADLLNAAKIIQSRTGCKIYYMGGIKIPGGRKVYSAGPDEWLGLIKNAEFVLTNSFHGSVFSIIFKKKFFSDIKLKGGKINNRVDNLLKMFNLSNHTIDNAINNYNSAQDWSCVEEVLLKERAISVNYLSKLCKKEK